MMHSTLTTLRTALVAAVAFTGTLSLRADLPPGLGEVLYAPADRTVEGDSPVFHFHTVEVLAPSNLVAPIAPLVEWEVVSAPAGVDEATALGYVSALLLPDGTTTPASWAGNDSNFDRAVVDAWLAQLGAAPANLIFSSPLQSRVLGLVFDGPANAVSGNYAYRLKLTGWTDEGVFTLNQGTHINVRVLDPLNQPEPPSVGIASPGDMESFTYMLGGPAVEVPVQVSGASSADTPVTALSASLSGSGLLNDLVVTGLNTAVAGGSATLSLTTGGIFTLTATATNAVGSSSTEVDFEVVVTAPPPTVVIDQPAAGSTFTFVQGGPGVSIPVSVTGNTAFGELNTLTLTLNGNPVSLSVTGLSTTSATGTATMVIGTPGTYTLAAQTASQYGTASNATTFSVQGVNPPPQVTVLSPDDGFEVTRFESDAATVVPFTFVADAIFGVIDGLTVTVNGAPVSFTSSGLGAAVVTGGGELVSSATETFLIAVTATSAGGTAYDQITVKVIESADPVGDENCPASVEWLPPISLGKTIQGGSVMPIKFKLRCDSGEEVLDPEVVIAVTEELAGGAVGDEWLFVAGGTPNGSTYQITGPMYHKNFDTACGVNRYRVEIYRPATAGSTDMVLIGTKVINTGGHCGSGKSCKSSKSDKSDKSCKSDKSSKSDKSDKSCKSDKSSKSGKSDKSGKSYGSSKSDKSDKNCDKSSKYSKSSKSDKSGKSYSASKSDKSDKSGKKSSSSSKSGSSGKSKSSGSKGSGPKG